ncbi:MAG: zinc ribbon domain-containing protein [Oscillospiraceae bacterium]|nr:zinc ribbon domain-containing protein [Oscillospiraceae bacterium]
MNCPKCGGNNDDGAAFCAYCGGALNAAPQNYYAPPAQPNAYQPNPYQPNAYGCSTSPEVKTVKENIPLGILGAVIGSLLGVASIVLFFQMNLVSAISGVILAFCTLKGYEILGKKLSNFGIIICILVMLAAPMIAFVFDEAIFLVKNWNMGFGDSVEFIIESIKSGLITFEEIMERVGKVYLFAAIGAVGIIINAFQKNKK